MANKTTTISIRFSRAEAKEFRRIADLSGKSVSAFVRDLALISLDTKLDELPNRIRGEVGAQLKETEERLNAQSQKLINDLREVLRLNL